jgi:cytochrome c oxidase subunit 4
MVVHWINNFFACDIAGNRDIVGYGWNGIPTYIDRPEFPCPAVRFRENTPEVLALREKEKGDWNKLTVEEKKACMYF